MIPLRHSFMIAAVTLSWTSALAAQGLDKLKDEKTDAEANVVYSNGQPGAVTGITPISNITTADDFTLKKGGSFSGIRFWADVVQGNKVAGPVTWSIWSDEGVTPGKVLYTGEAAPVVADDGLPGYFGKNSIRAVDLDLGSEFSLDPGTYWLSLTNPLDGYSTQWAVTPDKLIGEASVMSYNGSKWGAAGNGNLAFELRNGGVTTTPEPGTMALVGTGLVGLIPMIRRRKKN